MNETEVIDKLEILHAKVLDNNSKIKFTYEPFAPVMPKKPFIKKLGDEPSFINSMFLINFLISFLPSIYIEWLFTEKISLLYIFIFSVLFAVVVRAINFSKEMNLYKSKIAHNQSKENEFNSAMLKYEFQLKKYQEELKQHKEIKISNKPFVEKNNLLYEEIEEIKNQYIKSCPKEDRIKLIFKLSKYSNPNNKSKVKNGHFQPIRQTADYDYEQKQIITVEIFCPKCGNKFDFQKQFVGKITGSVGGAVTGAVLGGKIGIALGPLGAIAGTVPGAILGGVFGSSLGNKIDKPECPKCKTKFDLPS